MYPELLGTYGDGGNALALAWRARARAISVEVVEVALDDSIPRADLYLLGGGEDGPQRLATERLRTGRFAERIDDGAHVLAVCAGLQILGTTFAVENDDAFEGLGVVPAVTVRGTPRSVGDIATLVDHHVMVGFENHGGRTSLAPGLAPMGTVKRGHGNDGVVDGYRRDRLWATYAHGPVLALNPWLADEILTSVVGRELEAAPSVADDLYQERVRRLAP